MKAFALLTVALALGAFAAEVPAERLDPTVMPFGLDACGDDVEALARRLRDIRSRSGIRQFVLYAPCHGVRVTGHVDAAGHAAIGRKLKAVKDRVASDGIEVGYLMLPTMNTGIGTGLRLTVQLSDGKTRAFTPCPGNPEFRALFAAKCAAVAREAQPFLYMMEDDFRYFGRGCACDDHLARFAAQTGVRRTREELLAALARPESVVLRRQWYELQKGDLLLMAKAASEAVAAVSPETRIGLCANPAYSETDALAVARTLAGRHRPLIRWWGSDYGLDLPVKAAAQLLTAQFAAENLGGHELLYESDPVPHSRFYASAAHIGAMISWTMAMGYDVAYHWGLGGGADALATSPDYLDLIAHSRGRFAAIREEATKGRSSGICIGAAEVKPMAYLVKDDGRSYSRADGFRALNLLGIPVTTRQTDGPVLYAGTQAFLDVPDEDVRKILSGKVMLDGAAAETLCARGFAAWLGVKAERRDTIDFSGERTRDGMVDFVCSFHQNYGLDGSRVSRLTAQGAEEVAYFHAAGRHVQPSLTRFTNRNGGRVVVLAVNLQDCISPNVFSFEKRETLVGLFRWLGGEDVLPARVLDRANMPILAKVRKDGQRLFLHLLNLSCDRADSVKLEVAPAFAGGRVERLDGAEWKPAKAIWNGRTVVVSADMAVYGTLVLRLTPEAIR